MRKKKTNTKLPLYIAIIFFVVVGAFLFTQRNLLTQVLSPLATDLTIQVNGEQVPYFIDTQLPADGGAAFTSIEAPISIVDDGNLPRAITIQVSDQSLGEVYYGATVDAQNIDLDILDGPDGLTFTLPTTNKRMFPTQFLANINRYDLQTNQLLEESFIAFKVDVLREQ